MKGILVGSGQNIDLENLREESKLGDLIIAIDGGMDHLIKAGIIPDLIIGDLDSISEIGKNFIREKGIKKIEYPSEKDFTDMEIGIEYLKDENFSEILIFGSTGSRLDHTLGNIFLLNKIEDYKMKARIEDKNNSIRLVSSYLELDRENGGYISVIPVNRDGILVSLEGFKYPLDRYEMEFGATIGISNEIVSEKGIVKIHRGRAIVFRSRD